MLDGFAIDVLRLEQDLKGHQNALQNALSKIGATFDPLFAARVGEAAGLDLGRDCRRAVAKLRVGPAHGGVEPAAGADARAREGVARALGFARAMRNSLDATGDRDFIAELLFTLALLGVHLSRLAEDLILWSSAEFKFVELPDAFCTGSSLMPTSGRPAR